MLLRLLLVISQPSVSYAMLAVTGASDPSYASAFLKQMGDVLEYCLNFPAIFARLAFASGAAHRVGQLLETLDRLLVGHDRCATQRNGDPPRGDL